MQEKLTGKICKPIAFQILPYARQGRTGNIFHIMSK